MFKKLMASFGVGAAKVNLLLEKGSYRVGETVNGKVIVEGGNVDQDIQSLDVDVLMRVIIKGKEIKRVLDTFQVAQEFHVRAKETKEIAFEYPIPIHYPISKGSLSYSLITRMDISQAVDTDDSDPLVVLPTRDMQLVFDAFKNLGFKDKIGSGKIEQYGQQFEFIPGSLFNEQLKELELKFYSDPHGVKLLMEIEMNGGYMRNGIEHHTELTLPADLLSSGSVQQLADHIKVFLENELTVISVQGPRMAPSYHNYQQTTQHGSGIGGFMGGMVTGMLGGVLLGSLFDGGEEEDSSGMIAGDDENGFDFGLGDFMDFGDDEF
ncbi:SpoOM family protein [Desulforamulus reducens MI-1]|uniref:SpoOM family protein n=1 Tax=Desulforamulus reducens (strain ATCC BAA-1160 / DSM 100696 / MI-1) TaxID=349161 RepID=A4J1L3_DESRM|nr:sporulation protein [Desulforamulus reducens]ABO48966.1 SpoOM family protein [Desulforamulus reducens MI-1]